MATLNQLMALPGAVAAFAFSGNGDLGEHQIAATRLIDRDTLALMARMCAANLQIATLQASGWEQQTGTGLKGFMPVQDFTLVGLEWSVVVDNNRLTAVVLTNDKSDYEAAFAALEN